MFYGSFAHSLDEKNRLVIPRKMREELGQTAYIMKGFDGALSIYKQSAFEQLVEEIKALPYNKKSSRAYLRVSLSSVAELEIDKLGRVVIPPTLLEKFNISRNTIIIGALDHIEVWDKKAYEEYEKNILSSYEDLVENLTKEKE